MEIAVQIEGMSDDRRRIAKAWAALDNVMDPEIPIVSICDLGIVRSVTTGSDHQLIVVLTPTYCGCPAMDVITDAANQALTRVDIGPVHVTLELHPAWTTDWITSEGRRKLLAEGIVPPRGQWDDDVAAFHKCVSCKANGIQAMLPPDLKCPRCGSVRTQQLSAFGTTACKSLHRCQSCREPFEYFKPI